MNYYNQRSPEDFQKALAKGKEAEKTFIDRIALMGGSASSLGTIPANNDKTPRFSRPHPTNENGFAYSVSPDVLFTLPNQQKGSASLAQIKVKKHYSEPNKYIYVNLDEKELHRMNEAASFYNVLFVINIPELEGYSEQGFHDWMWLNVDDLNEDKTPLIKRMLGGKKTYQLPLDLFKPLTELTERTVQCLRH